MKDVYESPLNARYASREMQYLFSPDKKFSTWRRLWVILAECEQELGLPITDEQIAELKAHIDDIDYEAAAEREKEVRHDVMAHVHVYGELCEKARPIIHLGATSCYVCDNTDLLVMTEALRLIRSKVLSVIAGLSRFAEQYKALPTLAYTHYQAAQPTTVGKRATLWMHDLLLDLEDIDALLGSVKLLGSKGTTGTGASFLALFDGDSDKVRRLDRMIAERLGFAAVYPVSGQTYSRKVDDKFMHVLCGVAQSAAKFSNDLRLLQHMKEIEEPYEKSQIGSSAMAYKRNPMRCERMAGLCRYVMADAGNTAMTAGAQWLERTLDDSANRRIALPEAFLAIDAVLNTYLNVTAGLVVYEKVIHEHLMAELPFMATENIMMQAVKKGGDRQELHERVRVHSVAAAGRVKMEGLSNDLIARIAADPIFGMSEAELLDALRPELYIGCAVSQTEDFIREEIQPLLKENQSDLICDFELNV